MTTLACPPAPITATLVLLFTALFRLPPSFICVPSSVPSRPPLKYRHRGMPPGADAFALEHLNHGQRQNLQIEPKAAMVHIPNVELEFLFPRNGVAPVDLRPARDARFHFMTPPLLDCVPR